MINWESIKIEVEGSTKSIRAIAKEYGTSHTTINKKIEKEKWKRYAPPVAIPQNEVEIMKPYSQILGQTALRKIEEIKKELGKNYSNVDEPLIVMYAKSYEHYMKLEAIILKEGYVCISPKTRASYLNPNFNALQSVQKTLVTIANQLGLSMISRKQLGLKLGDDKREEPSLFDLVTQVNDEMRRYDV